MFDGSGIKLDISDKRKLEETDRYVDILEYTPDNRWTEEKLQRELRYCGMKTAAQCAGAHEMQLAHRLKSPALWLTLLTEKTLGPLTLLSSFRSCKKKKKLNQEERSDERSKRETGNRTSEEVNRTRAGSLKVPQN